MDQLPELRSDADVDALMARLRARITPPPARAAVTQPAAAGAALDSDLIALQEAFASSVVRAMTVMVETLEELGADEAARMPARVRPRTRPRRKKS